MQWPVAPEPVSLPALPDDLQVWDEARQEYCPVDLATTKAVFFVRSHTGSRAWHDHMGFFSKAAPVRNLWIRVHMNDGEVLEGRTVNDVTLLKEPGFWLWPTDTFSNNLLVYVPKTAVVEFHIMGVEIETPRAERSTSETSLGVEEEDVVATMKDCGVRSC
jgi:hypothetical protein